MVGIAGRTGTLLCSTDVAVAIGEGYNDVSAYCSLSAGTAREVSRYAVFGGESRTSVGARDRRVRKVDRELERSSRAAEVPLLMRLPRRTVSSPPRGADATSRWAAPLRFCLCHSARTASAANARMSAPATMPASTPGSSAECSLEPAIPRLPSGAVVVSARASVVPVLLAFVWFSTFVIGVESSVVLEDMGVIIGKASSTGKA
mmetsp:Transcript_10880/g.34578  ORF Transcript_10880/g.34578 Transcript_10880/m.34578 type:complete len:204 (+) Transcript_10880:243-854(+)